MKRYRGILKSDIAPDDVNTIWIDSSTDAYQIKVFEKDHWITPDAQTMQKVNTLILAANQTLQEAKTKAAAAETKANEASQKATAAESSASTASTAATTAQSALASTVTKVDQIKAAIEALPDGQAVSATVAEHTVKITNLESEVGEISIIQQATTTNVEGVHNWDLREISYDENGKPLVSSYYMSELICLKGIKSLKFHKHSSSWEHIRYYKGELGGLTRVTPSKSIYSDFQEWEVVDDVTYIAFLFINNGVANDSVLELTSVYATNEKLDSVDSKIDKSNVNSLSLYDGIVPNKGNIVSSTLKWANTTSSTIKHLAIKVQGGESLRVKGSSVGNITFYGLQSYDTSVDPILSTYNNGWRNWTKGLVVTSNNDIEYVIPDDVRYLVFPFKSPGNTYSEIPQILTINGVDLFKPILDLLLNDVSLRSRKNYYDIYDIVSSEYVNKVGTSNGLTFTRLENGYHINGIATAGTNYNVVNKHIVQSNTNVFLKFACTNSKVGIYVYLYKKDGTNTIANKYFNSTYIHIPNGYEYLTLTLRIDNGAECNDIAEVGLFNACPMLYKNNIVSGTAPYIITFKDDDTIKTEYVTKYRNACLHNGFKGNITTLFKALDDGLTDAEVIKQYEEEGFTIITHGYNQYENYTQQPLGLIRADMAKAIRASRKYDILNCSKYWQIPTGINSSDMIELAKDYGFRYVGTQSNGQINNVGDLSRYNIRTYSMKPDDSVANQGLAKAKEAVDNLMKSEGGLLVLTTHFADWKDLSYNNTLDSNGYPIGYARFNELAEYAKASGAKIMNFAQAMAELEPYFKD